MMTQRQDRLEREARTIRAMIGLYCRGCHPAASSAPPGADDGPEIGADAAAVQEACLPGAENEQLPGSRLGEDATLCADCRPLLIYALERIDRCPYGESKPVCSRCPIHCYRPAMQERIRQVMRYAGPRMMLAHPLLALRHWLGTIYGGPSGCP
jgi:hypothetical protein